MKRTIIILIVLLAFISPSIAQHSIDSVLLLVEKNNTSLAAYRKSNEASKIGNKSGIYLQNPEIGLNYLWGNKALTGNRTDINIQQSFDFPTAYGYRKQIAETRNIQSDIEYTKRRLEILYEARMLCTDITYSNALIAEYENRKSHAQKLANAYKTMFDKGEVNVIEYNKAQMNLLNLRKEVEKLNIERTAYLKQLATLNGGNAIEFSQSAFSSNSQLTDFDQWYSRIEKSIPELNWLKKEVEASAQQEKLYKALSLPKASAGYMSEKVTGEQFQGITVGLSIPLWENKNTVKAAKAQSLAIQEMETDNKLQYYNKLKTEFEKAISLQNTVKEYRQLIQSSNQPEMLKKAFDHGEISLLNYLMELSLSYSAIDNVLKSEYELEKAYAFLSQFEN